MKQMIQDKAVCTMYRQRRGFTLIEVVAALMILSLMCSSIVFVIKRCMTETMNTTLKMQALEVIRGKMEEMLASTSVKEGTDFGLSDEYPQITWQTTVENFPEPVNQRMWVKVTCGAEYVDANDTTQQLELTHWITSVTSEQLKKIIKEEQRLAAGGDGQNSGDSTDPANPDSTDSTDSTDNTDSTDSTKTKPKGNSGSPLDGIDTDNMSLAEILEILKEMGYLQ